MKREFGIDLIRTIAIFFVLSVHFFLNNSFYDTNIKGNGMLLSLFFRWIFYNGVPLFIILTGYLKNKKELNKNYYKGITRILISYLFISILCIFFRIFYLNEDINKFELLIGIFNFTTNEYAWYIEMYIGLFLLIPFLNILYNNIKTKKQKHYLIITLLCLVSISPLINYLSLNNLNLELIPNWWNSLYPLVYYFIGCYISEYKININKKKGIIIFMLIIFIETILSYRYNYNKLFSWDFLGGYNSIQTIFSSTLLFLILYNIKNNNNKLSKCLTSISILSLDMYLFSYITDNIVYPIFNNYIKGPTEYLKYYIFVIIIIFSLSYIFSLIKKIIFELFINKFKKVIS